MMMMNTRQFRYQYWKLNCHYQRLKKEYKTKLHWIMSIKKYAKEYQWKELSINSIQLRMIFYVGKSGFTFQKVYDKQ